MSRLMAVLLLTMAAGPAVAAEPAPIPAATAGGVPPLLPLSPFPLPLPEKPPLPLLPPLLPVQEKNDKALPATDSPAPAASQRPDRPLVRLLKGPLSRLAVKLRKPAKHSESEPNAQTTPLLNESEDLRKAREEGRRFWMNNQPSVLTYERLNGAIGPAQVEGSGAVKAAMAKYGSMAKTLMENVQAGRPTPTDPNIRTTQLLNESEDSGPPRFDPRRNNKPWPLNYERLNGAIGP